MTQLASFLAFALVIAALQALDDVKRREYARRLARVRATRPRPARLRRAA